MKIKRGITSTQTSKRLAEKGKNLASKTVNSRRDRFRKAPISRK